MDELLERCRLQGLRITDALQTILQTLFEADLPQSMQDLEAHPTLSKICDRATIFRTLQRLEGIGMLRRLNFSHTGAKFTLNTGDMHKEYLICKECGEVQELQMSCPVHALEKKIEKLTKYSAMTHELTFYGLCPRCA